MFLAANQTAALEQERAAVPRRPPACRSHRGLTARFSRHPTLYAKALLTGRKLKRYEIPIGSSSPNIGNGFSALSNDRYLVDLVV